MRVAKTAYVPALEDAPAHRGLVGLVLFRIIGRISLWAFAGDLVRIDALDTADRETLSMILAVPAVESPVEPRNSEFFSCSFFMIWGRLFSDHSQWSNAIAFGGVR